MTFDQHVSELANQIWKTAGKYTNAYVGGKLLMQHEHPDFVFENQKSLALKICELGISTVTEQGRLTAEAVYLFIKNKTYESQCTPEHCVANAVMAPTGINENTQNQKLYYIQNGYIGNAVCWWAQKSNGYTVDINLAQKYTEEDALLILKKRSTEKAWNCSYIDNLYKTQTITVGLDPIEMIFASIYE